MSDMMIKNLKTGKFVKTNGKIPVFGILRLNEFHDSKANGHRVACLFEKAVFAIYFMFM
jgi:hypothetical protein